MRPTLSLLGRNKALRSTIKQRLIQNIHRTKTPNLGTHTKSGGFIVDYSKVRRYVVPEDWEGFTLTPFVTNKIRPSPTNNGTKLNGEEYLKMWKRKGSD